MIPRTTTVALVLLTLLAACGGPDESATVPQARPVEETSMTVGNFTIHFSAQLTDSLPPQVAREYNIVRSKNRAMLNVAIIHEDGSSHTGTVTVKTRNLTGQLKDVQMRRIQEQEATYYIGEVAVANSETLVFDIVVTPDGADDPIEVRFKRQFYTS